MHLAVRPQEWPRKSLWGSLYIWCQQAEKRGFQQPPENHASCLLQEQAVHIILGVMELTRLRDGEAAWP